MYKVVFLDICGGLAVLFAIIMMTFIFFILPGCQIVYPDRVDSKILGHQMDFVGKSSRIHASQEANHTNAN